MIFQQPFAVTNALSCFTLPADGRPCLPHDHAGSVPQKARSSRAAFLMPNDRRPFRLRFRDGRSAPAPFPPSLRLRFTFPFAEPEAESLELNNSPAGFPVAGSGCRLAPRPFHRPPHPFARPAAIDTTRTPDISHQTCETDSPTAFGAADKLPGAETIVRHSSRIL
jgi:hypothetical protein